MDRRTAAAADARLSSLGRTDCSLVRTPSGPGLIRHRALRRLVAGLPTTCVEMTDILNRYRSRSAFALATWLLAAALTVSCSQGPEAPTAVTATSRGTVTEVFSSTLPVGGAKFYSFSLAAAGSVTATLTDISGTGVPPTVVVNLGIGTPGGTTCVATPSPVQVSGDAGLSTQVTQLQQAGVSCVIVADVGNLFAPASFIVTIDHP